MTIKAEIEHPAGIGSSFNPKGGVTCETGQTIGFEVGKRIIEIRDYGLSVPNQLGGYVQITSNNVDGLEHIYGEGLTDDGIHVNRRERDGKTISWAKIKANGSLSINLKDSERTKIRVTHTIEKYGKR